MRENINTRKYWEERFSSGDWEEKQGRRQTESFARGQIPFLRIGRDFAGTILDFGCGLGDAMPVYREQFPKARLIGVDISQSAVDICRERYSQLANFTQGDCDSAPNADVIIASNVLEHLTDDVGTARSLLSKCRSLHIVVPYRETPLCPEHVNTYDEHSFSELGEHDFRVFPCAGWSPFGVRLWYRIYFKNVIRFLLGRPLHRRNLQIIFSFSNSARSE